MKKAIILTIMFALVALTGWAQDRLIRVDSDPEARHTSRQRALFNQEKKRLLMPLDAAFGVECVPSFSPEWTLTYDSVAHALVYKIAAKSVWYTTYRSMHKQKKAGKNHTKSVPRKRPKNYVAPDVNTYLLSVTPEQVQKLRAIWRTAVGTAEDREVFMLDGTKWEFFVDGKRAKSHREKNVLVKFTNELADAVKTDNVSRKDSLLAASQNVITGLTTPPPPGKIQTAGQGQFEIDDRDQNTPYIKKLRVVTTVTYSLKD